MIAKTASGYNHPALPGRFFQKKAELQRALKVAWDYKSLTPEQQKLMGPQAPHEMSRAVDLAKGLSGDLDEIKAAIMSWARPRRISLPESIPAISNAQKLLAGALNVETLDAVVGSLSKAYEEMNPYASRDQALAPTTMSLKKIMQTVRSIKNRMDTPDESAAYASRKPGKKVAFKGHGNRE